jgi:carboxyl-terminal processing protease
VSSPLRRRLGFGALVVLLFAAGWLLGWTRAAARDRYEHVELFVEVLSRVEQFYVDPVEPKKLVTGAINGMLRRLDPFSNYLDEKALSSLTADTQGEFGGLGIVVSIRDALPTVISVLEGTPAYGLGILSGDAIVEIDGKSTRGLTIEDVVGKLRGPAGTDVKVQIRREGESEPRDYTITRQIIKVKSVPYAMTFPGRVGYVRLGTFSKTRGDELRRAIAGVEREGAKSLILDLRSNPGGLLTEAVDVAEVFLPKGAKVVETRGRAKGSNQTYYAQDPHPNLTQPLVVLTDDFTASAAEIVAGAIQDHDRGLVVGEPTFGKGSVQSVFNLPGTKAALKLTTAKYYTPSGRSIHKDQFNPHAGGSALATDDEDTEAEPPAPADTAKRPVFHTDAGRVVRGGGGIAPDLVIHPDTLISPAYEIERRGLLFKFAVKQGAPPAGAGAPPAVTPEQWDRFVEFLRSEKVSFTPDSLAAQRAYLETGIQRELARRTGGDAAAFRAAAPEDQVLQRALALLRKTRGPRELLKLSLLR